jgi:PmbA protein
MNRETYTRNITETSVSIMQSAVQAVRTKNITRSAVRMYDGKHIGIAGSLGDVKGDALEKKATESLSLQIDYPFEPASGAPRKDRIECTVSDSQAMVEEVEGLMADLSARHPRFIFSNKINLTGNTIALANDIGLDCSYSATTLNVELVVKAKDSANLIDTFVPFEGPRYSREAVLRIAEMACDGFLRPAQIADGRHPVCFFAGDMSYQTKMLESLNGLLLGSGSSLFSGKIGQKLFSDRVSILQSRAEADGVYEPFFDFEGTVNPDDRYTLVADGVLVAGYTNRSYASRFDLPLTGMASGEYDEVPDLGYPSLVIQDSGKTASELLDGRPAILVFIASGGDFTPDGAYATPVQTSYLFDGESIIGKLPEIALSSHLYAMFGDDFIGVSSNDLLPDTASKVFVAEMGVSL